MPIEELPSSIDAERSVLGAVIKNPKLIERISPWLPSSDVFWRTNHRKIWAIVMNLDKSEVPIDIVTVFNYYKSIHNEDISSEIAEITQASIQDDHVEAHAKIIWQRYVQRKSIEVGRQIEQASKAGGKGLDELIRQHSRWVEELSNLQPNRDRSIPQIADGLVNKIIAGENIIPFGLSFMDESAGGLTRGEISALGGRPGHGKTTLMLNLVDALATQGLNIVLFNREMTNSSAFQKLIVMNSDSITYTDIRQKTLPKQLIDRIINTKEILKNKYKNVRMYDDIRNLDESIREIKKFKPDVFLDDYIQLIKIDNMTKKERRFEIEQIMHEYKWVAKSCNCSGILISQLSREIEKRIDPSPTMGDYAEGSTIEQESENCFFIWYGYNFDPYKYTDKQAEFIIKKARYGKIGTYDLGFHGDKCKFFASVQEALIND